MFIFYNCVQYSVTNVNAKISHRYDVTSTPSTNIRAHVLAFPHYSHILPTTAQARGDHKITELYYLGTVLEKLGKILNELIWTADNLILCVRTPQYNRSVLYMLDLITKFDASEVKIDLFYKDWQSYIKTFWNCSVSRESKCSLQGPPISITVTKYRRTEQWPL